jgi:hypothetical protein
MDSKAFFESLENGDEYVTLITTKEVYNQIDVDLRPLIVLSGIRQKNDDFKNDETHKELRSNERNAKKELRDYEYLKNNK